MVGILAILYHLFPDRFVLKCRGRDVCEAGIVFGSSQSLEKEVLLLEFNGREKTLEMLE